MRKNLACMQGINEAMKSSSPHEMKFLLKKLKQDLLLGESATTRNRERERENDIEIFQNIILVEIQTIPVED